MGAFIVPSGDGGAPLRPRRRLSPVVVVAAVVALAAGLFAPGLADPAVADTAPAVPSDPRTPETVSTDVLATPQIGDGTSSAKGDTKGSGVVWDQVVIGDTVYVGGSFQFARPAGAAAGEKVVPRSNFLAYNLKTGVLLDYAPVFNAQIRSLTASPDGKRLYVAGSFTTVSDSGSTATVDRYRVAAFDVATGKLVQSFAPTVNSRVNAVVATDATVYIGGIFSSAQKTARSGFAALNAADATILPWAPVSAGGEPLAMVISPDASKLVVAGSFTSLNGSSKPGYGMAAVSAAGPASTNLPWKVNSSVRNAGAKSSISSLTSDGQSVYGTATMSVKNLEGIESVFKASWADGTLEWKSDCHGDSYSVAVSGDAVYSVSHAHYCGGIGGFAEGTSSVSSEKWHRALAFSKATTGVLKPWTAGGAYGNYGGQPSPSLLDWYPDVPAGTFTGLSQAAWDVTTAQGYVLLGGEFPTVNGVKQHALARFAPKSAAPNKDAPQLEGAAMKPQVRDYGTGAVRLSWPANYDRDNAQLTYQVIRDGNVAQPVATKVVESRFWSRPTVSTVVSDLAIGTTYRFRIRTTDPFGNARLGDEVTVTPTGAASSPLSDYDRKVVADGARAYWPLSDSAGTPGVDIAGANDMGFTSQAFRNTAGVPSAGAAATTFAGNSGSYGASTVVEAAPQVFSMEAWVRTSAKQGGQIMGFGSTRGTSSPAHDRKVWMRDNGTITFGVHPGLQKIVTSKQAYNDGKWHHVVSTLGANGMQLIIDGVIVGADASVKSAAAYTGYWNLGGHTSGWVGKPTNAFLPGVIDNVAVYDRVLSPAEALGHYQLAGSGAIPETGYDNTVRADKPSAYWPLSELSSRGAADVIGTNDLGLSSSATRGAEGAEANGKGTTFVGNAASYGASTVAVAAPRVFSMEAWVRTSAKQGGQIMGFGSTRNASSPTYDRLVWMRDNGTITFGVHPGSQKIVTSKQAYNDGKWHHVVSTLGTNGMQLIVDGVVVAADASVKSAAAYSGYWNLGGHASAWTGKPTSAFLPGAIDNVAVYNRVLSPAQVTAHYRAIVSESNVTPTASFTSAVNGLTVSVDGAGSSDPDGKVASYAWDFGDGSTGTGVQASHVFAKAGTYTVALTVTDDRGGKATVSKSVTVTSEPTPPAPADVVAEDAFERSSASGWGSAVTGGAWTSGKGSTTSVGDGAGKLTGAKGQTSTVALPGAMSDSSDTSVSFRIDNAPTGGGQHVWVTGRQVGADSYSARILVQSNGVLQLLLQQSGKNLAVMNLPDVKYTPGDAVHVRFQVTGSGTTTLQAKVWTTGVEPAGWTKSVTDTTAALQAAGSVGLGLYVSGSATAPSTVSFDDYVVKKVAP